MTKSELTKIDTRLDEIMVVLEDQNLTNWERHNLQSEISQIIGYLETSVKQTRIEESGLKLIIGGVK